MGTLLQKFVDSQKYSMRDRASRSLAVWHSWVERSDLFLVGLHCIEAEPIKNQIFLEIYSKNISIDLIFFVFI